MAGMTTSAREHTGRSLAYLATLPVDLVKGIARNNNDHILVLQ